MSGDSRPRPIQMIPLRRCGSHALRLRLQHSPPFYSLRVDTLAMIWTRVERRAERSAARVATSSAVRR